MLLRFWKNPAWNKRDRSTFGFVGGVSGGVVGEKTAAEETGLGGRGDSSEEVAEEGRGLLGGRRIIDEKTGSSRFLWGLPLLRLLTPPLLFLVHLLRLQVFHRELLSLSL